MLIVSIAWVFVVGLFAIAHASAPGGSVLGALLTLVLGLAPLVVLIYIAVMASRRRRARLARSATDPDGGGHAAGDAVAAKREEA
jgi:Na+/H+-dicarboxylate symporter